MQYITLAEISPFIILIYLLTGMLAGLIGGMLGLGGGIIIVPIIYYVYAKQGFHPEVLMQMAVTTSLATVLFTALSAGYVHHKKNTVIWSYVFKLAPGIMLGAYLGGVIVDVLPSDFLKIMFGVFEIMVAIQISFGLRPAAKLNTPTVLVLFLIGFFIGIFSTLLGIGGGTLIVPILLFFNMGIRNAVAISSVCGFAVAIVGTIVLIFVGLDNTNIPLHSIGYLYWPATLVIIIATIFSAPIGANLTHYFSVKMLKRFFGAITFIVGLKMLF